MDTVDARPAPRNPPTPQKHTADSLVRWSTIAVVVAVAIGAAVVSYRHAYELVLAHGEIGVTATIGPLTVDGMIYASSMVLLQSARNGHRGAVLAYLGLALGILATVAANVAHGLAHGAVGAVVGAWPAVALVLSYEMLMWIVRAGRLDQAPPPAVEVAEVVWTLPEALARVVESGVSRRQIADELGVSRDRVSAMVRQARPPVEQVADSALTAVSETA